jgi:exosortase/archaeosortase family protein
MSGRPTAVFVRILVVLAVAVSGFALLQGPSRQLEAQASTSLLRAAGARGVFAGSGDSILVLPSGRPAFRAVVTPACSALSSVLCIVCLASFAPRRRRWAWARGLLCATTVVVAGNIVRIATSVAVGLLAGRASLVLFHDLVGSAFAFAYTLGGYVLFLYLLLPANPDPLSPEEPLPWNMLSSSPSSAASAYS